MQGHRRARLEFAEFRVAIDPRRWPVTLITLGHPAHRLSPLPQRSEGWSVDPRRRRMGGRRRLTLTGKIDAILKLSIVASVLFASSSVGYYYLSYLPHRDARFEPDRALEGLRAAAQKRAEREKLLLEQQVSEQRALEQQAAEQRQLLEKADRYQACLSHATDGYNESRIAACNRLQEKVIRDHD